MYLVDREKSFIQIHTAHKRNQIGLMVPAATLISHDWFQTSQRIYTGLIKEHSLILVTKPFKISSEP